MNNNTLMRERINETLNKRKEEEMGMFNRILERFDKDNIPTQDMTPIVSPKRPEAVFQADPYSVSTHPEKPRPMIIYGNG